MARLARRQESSCFDRAAETLDKGAVGVNLLTADNRGRNRVIVATHLAGHPKLLHVLLVVLIERIIKSRRINYGDIGGVADTKPPRVQAVPLTEFTGESMHGGFEDINGVPASRASFTRLSNRNPAL